MPAAWHRSDVRAVQGGARPLANQVWHHLASSGILPFVINIIWGTVAMFLYRGSIPYIEQRWASVLLMLVTWLDDLTPEP